MKRQQIEVQIWSSETLKRLVVLSEQSDLNKRTNNPAEATQR